MAKSGLPKWLLVLGGITVFFIVIIGWVVGQYNTLIELDGDVQNEWSNVEVQYQRRADLIPSLISTVQGAADFESSTYLAVTEARTKWLEVASDADASIDDQIAASQAFDSAISGFMINVEAYPALTASENFLTLQAELEGTENRVAVARMDYNDSATTYNIASKRIPMVFFANTFGFEEYSLFESDDGSEEAPEVEFDFGTDE